MRREKRNYLGFTSKEVPNMLSLTKDIVFEIEWGGVPVIGGSRWSVMSCGATNDEDVMTAYTYPSIQRNTIPNQISPLGNPLSIVCSFPSLASSLRLHLPFICRESLVERSAEFEDVTIIRPWMQRSIWISCWPSNHGST